MKQFVIRALSLDVISKLVSLNFQWGFCGTGPGTGHDERWFNRRMGTCRWWWPFQRISSKAKDLSWWWRPIVQTRIPHWWKTNFWPSCKCLWFQSEICTYQLCIGLIIISVILDGSKLYHQEGFRIQSSDANLSPLEDRQQKIWPHFSNSSRCQSLWQRCQNGNHGFVKR